MTKLSNPPQVLSVGDKVKVQNDDGGTPRSLGTYRVCERVTSRYLGQDINNFVKLSNGLWYNCMTGRELGVGSTPLCAG